MLFELETIATIHSLGTTYSRTLNWYRIRYYSFALMVNFYCRKVITILPSEPLSSRRRRLRASRHQPAHYQTQFGSGDSCCWQSAITTTKTTVPLLRFPTAVRDISVEFIGCLRLGFAVTIRIGPEVSIFSENTFPILEFRL